MARKIRSGLVFGKSGESTNPAYLSIDPKEMDLYRYVDVESIFLQLGYEIKGVPKEIRKAHPRRTIRHSKKYMYKFLIPDPCVDCKSDNKSSFLNELSVEYRELYKTSFKESEKDLKRFDKFAKSVKNQDDKDYVEEFDDICKNSGNRLAVKIIEAAEEKKRLKKIRDREFKINAKRKEKRKEGMSLLYGLPARLGLGGVGYAGGKIISNTLGDKIPFLKENSGELAMGIAATLFIGAGYGIDKYQEMKDNTAEKIYQAKTKKVSKKLADSKRAIVVQTLAEVLNTYAESRPEMVKKFGYKSEKQIKKELNNYLKKYEKYAK
ncbi:MAG: hypothetical protein GOV02_01675 [Candidatus Aenigmarchaeota archaeon]|nr:hypothetical protein [Candidatus Aenigmarchaeota archaeon]